jgi:type II secretory pathway component GspD/PulD (secretin)
VLTNESSVVTPQLQVKELEPIQPQPGIKFESNHEQVQLTAQGANLPSLLQMIADYHQLNLVVGPGVEGKVTVTLQSATLDEVLDALLTVNGFTWNKKGKLLYVTTMKSEGVDPRVQGRRLQMFQLNFVTAADVQKIITGLLSTVGQSFIAESNNADQARTQEVLVVEDVPSHLSRIQQLISQVDQPPRQVLIEAHVLQVTLSNESKHGINLEAIARASGARISFKSQGFAESNTPGLALGIDGTDLDGLIQCIQQLGNTRTLASPKVMVVNRQEAKIQIGSQLGYFVTTATQVATLQSVQFLDLGVVLTVTPIISDDNRILMKVLPKVSGGRINPTTGLPEEETTEVATTVLLPDGGGIVIGGLIKDHNSDQLSKIPKLGDLPLIGGAFRRKTDLCRRDEIIIAMVAHLANSPEGMRPHEHQELQQVLPDYVHIR